VFVLRIQVCPLLSTTEHANYYLIILHAPQTTSVLLEFAALIQQHLAFNKNVTVFQELVSVKILLSVDLFRGKLLIINLYAALKVIVPHP